MTDPAAPLQLVLVAANLGPGGAEKVMTMLANGWAGQGSRITLITLDGSTGTFFPLDATTFRFEFTGQSCFGPIYGTEILRLGSSNPPAQASGAATDMWPLSSAVIHNSPLNVASWPITSRINAVELRPNGIYFDFSKKDGPGRWPDWTPPGWDGPLQYTVWAAVNIGGQWYTSGFIQMWRGRASTGAPILSDFARNWAYDWQRPASPRARRRERRCRRGSAAGCRGTGAAASASPADWARQVVSA